MTHDERWPSVAQLTPFRIDGCQDVGGLAIRRHSDQASAPRSCQDLLANLPTFTGHRAWRQVDALRRTAENRDLQQLVPTHLEPDPLAVRRKEEIERAVRARQRRGVKSVESEEVE